MPASGGLFGTTALTGGSVSPWTVLAGAGGVRAPAEVFSNIFVVFLGLGTLVGIVVVGYTLYNAYKYRYREGEDPAPEIERPEMGELPEGGGKGKKLFLSFGLSAIVVLSLILWTYGALLHVENTPTQLEQADETDVLDVQVTGYQFGWDFTYPNNETTSTLTVPTDTVIRLHVTSRDVFHNFGIPQMGIKSDAIPGETTTTWFVVREPKTLEANCYELCGTGHSYMDAEVQAVSESEYQEWYSNLGESNNATQASTTKP
jgi:cytochrome c oxidase subunit 2